VALLNFPFILEAWHMEQLVLFRIPSKQEVQRCLRISQQQ
jgi:hypothetical protein